MNAKEFLDFWLKNNGNPVKVDRTIIDRAFKQFKNTNSPEFIQKELLIQISEYRNCMETLPKNSFISNIQYSNNSTSLSSLIFNDLDYILKTGGSIHKITHLDTSNSNKDSIENFKLHFFLQQFSIQIQELQNVSLLNLLILVSKKKNEFIAALN
jgi:hypothetical protein